MTPVTTVALIARRPELSRELFSRYWRDVHGMLATRFSGFLSYAQYHLGDPLDGLYLPEIECNVPNASQFDGLAEVCFADEPDRNGLLHSDVAAMIHEDEQNAFRATLLYNLGAGASRTLLDRLGAGPGDADTAVLLLAGRNGTSAASIDTIANRLSAALARHPGILRIRWHALASGNPRDWDTPNVDHGGGTAISYDAIVQVAACSQAALIAALTLACARDASGLSALGTLHIYPVTARYVMVENSRPTLLGLRGMDVQQTIDAVGARNQCEPVLLQRLYGCSPLP